MPSLYLPLTSRAARLAGAGLLALGTLLPVSLVAPAGSPLTPRPAQAASLVVNTLTWAFLTDGACSLAEAYANTVFNHNLFYPDCGAGSAVALDTISFGVSGTILTGLGGLTHESFHGPLAFNGFGQNVVLDAQGLGQNIYNLSGDLSITSLTLTNSGTFGLTNEGNLVANNLTISNSTSNGFLNGGAATATLNNTTISGNTAGPGTAGGGVRNNGTLTITNSTITGNSSPGFWGGGVWNELGTLTITNSTISNNTAATGAGIMSWPPSTLTVANSTISGNVATGGGGGFQFQGGADLASATNVTIRNSTISGNTAANGGGMLMGSGTIPATITNSTISGNTATTNGGGLNVVSGSLTLTNTTVANNAAATGGGIRQAPGATVNLRNTLLGDNTATAGPDCSGTMAAGATPNLVEDTTGCTVTGTAPITGAPFLGTLASNGGSTLTRSLLPGSPALNAGDAAICAAAPVNALDQRGVARPQGPACDLGAFESALSATVIGGKNFTIGTGSIDLSWDTGTAQDSYSLLKYNTSTAAASLIALPGAATSYSDVTASNGVVYCYVLAALGPGFTFLGLSDLLCGMTGLESGTVIPQDFALKLGQSTNATMTWAPPVGGAGSYLLQVIPLDGSPVSTVPLGGGATSTVEPVTGAGTCFQLIAFQGPGFGTSNLLCGVPGVSTLSAVTAVIERVQVTLAGSAAGLAYHSWAPFRWSE